MHSTLLWQVPLSGGIKQEWSRENKIYILNVYVNISKTVKNTSKVTVGVAYVLSTGTKVDDLG